MASRYLQVKVSSVVWILLYYHIEVASEVHDSGSVLTTKSDAIARFIHVIQPLARVYDLPPSSLHIFYDIAGDLIAFNRNASLFLNLRFFEAWRAYGPMHPCQINDLVSYR